jgi:hypothetical protein
MSISSCWIFSEAIALPPGLLTRSTTAFTDDSARSLRNSRESPSPPTLPGSPFPSTMSPSAYTMATLCFAL